MVKERSGEEWELHLKATREGTYIFNRIIFLGRNLFGYLIPKIKIQQLIDDQLNSMLNNRKLPLVLDLDDTLVRSVGVDKGRFVHPDDLGKGLSFFKLILILAGDRVRVLESGLQVVITDRVEEFLSWASNLYEISVCSLG